MADRQGEIVCMRPTLIEKSSTVLPPILIRSPTVVGSSEPSSRVIRSRSSATCRSCSSICFLCVSTVSWASFYPRKTSSERPLACWQETRLPSFSVHSCIARWRPIAAREVVAVAVAAGVAVVAAVGIVDAVGVVEVVEVVGAVVGDIAGIADKPGEVAGTWWVVVLVQGVCPALHFVPDPLLILNRNAVSSPPVERV